ncbi:MAG TPA: efflux RND transporter periplasmic adaptor subunit [Syntrophales bacterium]|nr:efflux RND transporter periplasmic adaptor subunit [Syntrophales bacterium]
MKLPRMEGKQLRIMIVMLVVVGVIFGIVFGWKAWQEQRMKKSMAGQIPPVTVSAMKAEPQPWQPRIRAVGSLRAVRGVDVTSEISGLVRTLHFQSGDVVETGRLLVQLNADADIAQLHALEAAAELAQTVFERDKKQLAIQAVSQATVDADSADLKSKKALAAQQAALIEKKSIRAPFAGKLGITTVNPGQYINPGDKIVTLQTLDPIYIDFYLPQQELSRIAINQKLSVSADGYPGQTFSGRITAINPRVNADSRNIQVEGMLSNPRQLLLPGMYASVEIAAGQKSDYITLPQTAISFNPYGNTVFVVEQGETGPDGKARLTAKQKFVTTGAKRGDQIAVLEGIKEGELVVTGGQLKLRSGSPVIIDNRISPTNEPAPKPTDD